MKPDNVCTIPVYGHNVVVTVPADRTAYYGSYEASAEALVDLIWNKTPGGFVRALLHELKQRESKAERGMRKWFREYKKEQAKP